MARRQKPNTLFLQAVRLRQLGNLLLRRSACMHASSAAQSLWKDGATSKLPQYWGEAFLVWFPKPNKPPCNASNLRPISLIQPEGKIIASILMTRLQPYLENCAACTPQYAYLPHRSSNHAIARVLHDFHAVQEQGKPHQSTIHVRKARGSRTQLPPLEGGFASVP